MKNKLPIVIEIIFIKNQYKNQKKKPDDKVTINPPGKERKRVNKIKNTKLKLIYNYQKLIFEYNLKL